MKPTSLFAGLDFGTESVRVVIVDGRGATRASAEAKYAHGQIVRGSEAALKFFAEPLSPVAALQHPIDWIDSAAAACREALSTGRIQDSEVVGIGVDFTSCTMLPCRGDGTPLCVTGIAGDRSEFANDPHAWPKLWKHHGALEQAARMTAMARAGGEKWLAHYGGIIGLEWLQPKMLEVIERAPRIAAAAEVWLEAGDWLVWQLTGAPLMNGSCDASRLPRSTCQAGYKALWSRKRGYPSQKYFNAIHPDLAAAMQRTMPGHFVAPGERAGTLCRAMADRLGLREGTAVSAAIIDAHSGVPGAGVGEAGTLVMVMGTSGCHMLLANVAEPVSGIAGIVDDGILPGFVGYETGQAAMGDLFDWARRLAGDIDFATLEGKAAAIPAGCEGLTCLDWHNGCRTPLMDASLHGSLHGLTLHHSSAHVYRAALEGSAFGLRWIVDTLRNGNVPVNRFVATGGLPHRNALFMSIVATALESDVSIHAARNGPALGAAILGSLAAGKSAGGFDDVAEAVHAMAGAGSVLPRPVMVHPQHDWRVANHAAYERYLALASRTVRSLGRQ